MRKKERIRLFVLLSAFFMAQFDFFVVNVAAPSLQASLHAGPAALELIVGGYAFAYAAGMITAGRLGDSLGHRRVFVAGVLAFAVASLLCGLARDPGELIAARLLQGLAGAIMVPQVLGTVTATFPPRDRPRAVAWYGVTGGVASIAGQVLGGWLLGADVLGLGWRIIFLVNVPIGAVGAIAAQRVLERRVLEQREPQQARARLDLPGAAGVAATLALLLIPLTLGRTAGWPAWTWACLAAAVPAALLTGWWQRTLRRRGGQPVLETALFRVRTFTAGVAATIAFMAYFGSFMFTLTLLLQDGFGLSPFRAGAAFAPMGIAFSVTSLGGRPLVARYGNRIIVLGCAISAAGLALFATHPSLNLSLTLTIVAAGVAGAGNGLILPQLLGLALGGVRPERAGIGAGMLMTAQQFASSAGVTIIGSVFFAVAGARGSGPQDYAGAARVTALISIALVALVAVMAMLAERRPEAEPPPVMSMRSPEGRTA